MVGGFDRASTATTVIIADAKWLSGLQGRADIAQFEAGTIWFFGDDHELYLALRRTLPVDTPWGDVGQRINNISTANQRSLIDMEHGIHINDVSWWECRNIAERGPYSTSFTTDCCRYLLFCDLLAEGGNHIFIVEAPDFGDLLAYSARQQSIHAKRLGPGGFIRWANTFYIGLRGALGFASAAWRRWRLARQLTGRRKAHPVPIDKLRDCDVLFAAWTQPGDFPKSGHRDLAHSLGLLPKRFRERGINVGFIALPLDEICDPVEIIEHVTNSEEAAILPDDTIGWCDLLIDCLWTLCAKAGPIAGFRIGGHSIDGVARMVMSREQFDWRATNARLWSHIGPFLAARGSRPKAVFHVYENQTWEKGLRQGFRHALPGCRVIGCMQSPMSGLYLNMLPAFSERPPERWPDVVLAHGALGARQLVDAGAPRDSVVNTGLFRQGAFLRERQASRSSNGQRRIICATGPGYQECLELARKSAEAVQGRADMVLIINFHPITTDQFRNGVRRFIEGCGAMNDQVQFSNRPINDLFKEGIDAVLYADTNSGFEAVSSGTHAIHIQRDHALSFDKLPDGLSRHVRTVEEIRQALDEIGDDGKWPSEEFVTAALADCFSEVDLDAILAAAGIGSHTKIAPESEFPEATSP